MTLSEQAETFRAMSLHGAWMRRERKRKAQLAALAVELAAAEADLAQKLARAGFSSGGEK